jgi:hypothetical protein
MTWQVIVINRPGLDMLHFDEAPLDRTFPTRREAERWALENYGGSPRDRLGWRVEPALQKVAKN